MVGRERSLDESSKFRPLYGQDKQSSNQLIGGTTQVQTCDELCLAMGQVSDSSNAE